MTNQEPQRNLPNENWEYFELYNSIKDALYNLPYYFRTETVIEGISAIDIFTLNSALGATIENQVVNTLNQMRTVWDPHKKYSLFSFVRQSQTFPDVLLRRVSPDEDKEDNIILVLQRELL